MRSLLLSFLLFCSLLCGEEGGAVDQEPVEGAPVFFANELVDDLPLKTELYSVFPLVEVVGFDYEFRVNSLYGEFRARGRDGLGELLREIEAIEKLNRVSQGEAFASALSDGFTEPVMTTYGVARRPVRSITGLPGGMVRYLGGKVYQVRRGSGKVMEKVKEFRTKDSELEEEQAEVEEEKEGLGKSAGRLSRKHLGHDNAKRKWARRLGVDPYSNNEALQEALGRIAWASSLGGFADDFVVPSHEVFSYAGKARELVWDRPGYQIEREMVGMLKKDGVSKELIQEFRDADMFSLTEKLELCLAFCEFESDRAATTGLKYALEVESVEDATLFLDTVELLIRYHNQVGRLVSVGDKRGMIYAYSINGYEIYPFAVDYLHWTPLVYEALLDEELKAERREIWVSGTVSPIAKMRLRHHGWQVFDQVGR
ncbi:hypothetical protein [Pelagicoccus mobilis]|uniref:Uncharacterized protein n=1 Tax=Pelagicoccus mobilis TaxID=415221 RepID=A0A934S1W7_9BACT|nr:hypothetical protein [Pelagicoccus mobilis]MBK1879106.1 hypothetical protein [Pelagicoccus mobilis]